jgi:hypothetical protein
MMYTIEYSIRLPGELRIRQQSFTSDEPSWAPLAEQGKVTLPEDMFTPDSVVPDEAVGIWNETSLQLVERPVEEIDLENARVVLLTVESPHVSEYGPGFKPIAPLQDTNTRYRLRTFLPTHLRKMAVPKGAWIVACNPVQWQASLGRLRSKRTRPGEIRTLMWRALFEAGWRKDFERRLVTYNPSWVLNACTKELKADVDTSIVASGMPTWEASHPSSLWFRKLLAVKVR